jgi:hypothetical protein
VLHAAEKDEKMQIVCKWAWNEVWHLEPRISRSRLLNRLLFLRDSLSCDGYQELRNFTALFLASYYHCNQIRKDEISEICSINARYYICTKNLVAKTEATTWHR